MTAKIGIAITHFNRPKVLEKTMAQMLKFLPTDAELIVVDDGSEKKYPHTTFRFEQNMGISVAKNKCIEILMARGCQHIFLFDDDTYPTAKYWWMPYVLSPEPHLQYNFVGAPSHWPIKKLYQDGALIQFNGSRGCMLYVESHVIDIVGGMHNVFGKHGHEHEEWSERIHKAGLTSYPFQGIDKTDLYCLDENEAGISSVSFRDNQGWRHIDDQKLPQFAEYRTDNTPPVLVARRNDNGHRDRVWRHLKENFWRGMVPFEGYQKSGAFNRSEGLNIASLQAGNWDVAVFADCDAFIEPDKLNAGITLARSTQKMVLPFSEVIEISKDVTDSLLANHSVTYNFYGDEIEKTRTEPMTTQSMMVIVPRNIFEQIGGFDEGFVGWGGEDNAFYRAAEIVGGEVLRMPGSVYHLWHEAASRDHQPQNNSRWRRYQNALNREDLARIRRDT